MMKLRTRYGDMFSCGWLPPVGKMQAGFMELLGCALEYRLLGFDAHKLPPGPGAVGALGLPTGTWLCAGNSEMLSVCAVSPPRSPSTMPSPTCTGMRPCRLGRPKFTRPSP